ncbi:leucine-rich repeat-containing protein 15-like [Harmonia axyridis]|uniref:leucine-rich repeat-containing protein 15-like n=1 Tax=Harmonia axyridis TaxID=115357 RepID=UPI001E27890F|nr:leucine-rich repeat-containing protein 15-like [Harmonia axyridis]
MFITTGLLGTFLILSAAIFPEIFAKKDLVFKNFHGEFSLAAARANVDAETILMEKSTLTAFPLSLFSIMVNSRKVTVKTTKILQPMDPNMYEGGRKLEEILFSHNEINEYPVRNFRNTTFEKITIQAQPQVKIITKDFASETQRLKYFECSECKIDTIEEGAFNNLDKLEVLDLHKNSITKLTDDTLSPLKSLKRLNLAENQLTKLTTNAIKQCTKLENIDLSDNPLTELNLLDANEVLPNLKTVSLIRTQIPEAVIEEHKQKTKIRFLTVEDNQIKA